jgi:hypothetical protein
MDPRMKVISIESAARSKGNPDLPPQPTPPAAISLNKWTRRSFLRMFALGNGIWKIARFHHVTPHTVEAELRDRLIESGVMNDKAA